VTARDAARQYAAGRVALGAGLLLAPGLVGRPWLGAAAGEPAGRVALRALGVRDLIIGAIAVHTVDHPEVAPRWQRACAVADGVDLAATLAARPGLPPVGSALVAAMAAAGTAAGLLLAEALRGGGGSAA
jgi:hypothetical protein